MIVIHINTTQDTGALRECYQGLDGLCIVLLENPSRDLIDSVLNENPNLPVMLLGHGSPNGLFGIDSEFAIDDANANLLQERIVIGIWCYAAEFADRNNLEGFFTSMFISNMSEALMCGFPETEQDDIDFSNLQFSREINRLLITKTPIDRWISEIQSHMDIRKPFIRYNLEALYSNTTAIVNILKMDS